MPIRHTVQQGECFTTIASRHGFKDYRTIYDHPDNAELKRNRPNPNVLAVGDVVVVPDRVLREETLPVDRTHRVKLHRPTKELRIVFKDASGEPLQSAPYTFEIAGADPVESATDGSGMLKEPVPIGVSRAKVTIQSRTLELRLGALDPLAATADEGATGVRGRLRNLGYAAGTGELPRSAIAVFQHDRSATIDGELTDELRDALETEHGS